jgi:hypothetical protein
MVILGAFVQNLPAPMVKELSSSEALPFFGFIRKNRDRFFDVGCTYVNLDFLAQCKLLDMPTFKAALQGNPSPIAMAMAVVAAHESMTPDYPLTPSYDYQLSNFIEQLVHANLIPLDKVAMEDEYPDFEDGYELAFDTYPPCNFKIVSGYKRKKDYVDDISVLGIVPYDEDAYTMKPVRISQEGRHPGCCLNLDYLANQGLLDLDLYNTLAAVGSRIEALQYAVRKALNPHSTKPLDTMELPTDFILDN